MTIVSLNCVTVLCGVGYTQNLQVFQINRTFDNTIQNHAEILCKKILKSNLRLLVADFFPSGRFNL